ncbi:putative Holliday junction resolvase [Novipirellula galeiformis]|uniref:Putative pre-16S rRNA nuclease n=1 Tax=Novipirellula galeiformis TaxID=2528004 RepID=A0A5C6CG62_9BACT|nr:Holliday junction resolvase RuvX [Novipirellula galeiformis]TWU23055.1 putative Holliday junction resolvase [Novipirellula galeiformis]
MTESSDTPGDFPATGRLAAIDFGSVRIGIAICDPDRILASPLEVHSASEWAKDGDYYRELTKQERIAAFVVGLPIHLDGGESEKSLQAREFARWLSVETGKPVRLFDERFTTADANNRMRAAGYTRQGKKKRLDAVAALVILESFIEACRYRGELVGEPLGEPSEETPGDTPSKGESIG